MVRGSLPGAAGVPRGLEVRGQCPGRGGPLLARWVGAGIVLPARLTGPPLYARPLLGQEEKLDEARLQFSATALPNGGARLGVRRLGCGASANGPGVGGPTGHVAAGQHAGRVSRDPPRRPPLRMRRLGPTAGRGGRERREGTRLPTRDDDASQLAVRQPVVERRGEQTPCVSVNGANRVTQRPVASLGRDNYPAVSHCTNEKSDKLLAGC